MMRTSLQPLAHLVDAAAEKWLAVETATPAERDAVRRDIAGSFNIGDRDELTFHGRRFLLTVMRVPEGGGYTLDVHEIALDG